MLPNKRGRSQRTAAKESLCSSQLEKANRQQQRSQPKNKINKIKKKTKNKTKSLPHIHWTVSFTTSRICLLCFQLYPLLLRARLGACWGFPVSLDGKESAYSVGELGSTPESGRSPGEGNGIPLQYSCQENPMDAGAWWAVVHGVAKSQTRLSNFDYY